MSGTEKELMPGYAAELAAFHRAFAGELKDIIDSLPLSQRMRVIDVGCGDGFYLELLCRRLGPQGSIVGLDINARLLDVAKEVINQAGHECGVEFRCGSLAKNGSEAGFDFVWSAQSLFSLPSPLAGMRQMKTLLRPGGMVAVLENDTLHQLFLPWPSELELAIRAAEMAALAEESQRPAKFYIGRRLPSLFAEAGLEPLGFRTQSIDRQAPLDADLSLFLQEYLATLRQRVEGHMEPGAFRELEALTEPSSSRCLLNDPNFTMTWINVLALGRVPLAG